MTFKMSAHIRRSSSDRRRPLSCSRRVHAAALREFTSLAYAGLRSHSLVVTLSPLALCCRRSQHLGLGQEASVPRVRKREEEREMTGR